MKVRLTFAKIGTRWYLYLPAYGGKKQNLELGLHASKVLDFVQGNNTMFLYMTVDAYVNECQPMLTRSSNMLRLQRFWQAPEDTAKQGARYHLAGNACTDLQGNTVHEIWVNHVIKWMFWHYPRTIALDLASVTCTNTAPATLPPHLKRA